MRILIKTYGCQMNERDSEAALALLVSKGHSAASSEDDANAIILNTCSVRDQAERKAIGKLGLLVKLKRKRPALIVGAIGCMAQRIGQQLLDEIPHLDFAIGTSQIASLPEIIEEIATGARGRSIADGGADAEESMDFFHAPPAATNAFSSSVSISRGCNRFCSYCIVPYVRGRERSRKPESIIDEIKQLADAGAREITLLGQNVAAYGLDGHAPPIAPNISPFAELLEKISQIEALKRIRFTSPHPAFYNRRLIDAIAALPKVCNSLHLPLQSGSDRILKLMNRPYTALQFLNIVDELKSKVPGVLFSTDIIVGFPGEGDEDFQATREIMEEVGFDNAYIFKYSPRSGTKAAEMADDVPAHIKEARNATLLEDLKRRFAKSNADCVGQIFEVMAEGPSKRNKSRWAGRTSNNKIAIFKAPASIQPGEMIKLRIVSSTPSTIFGEPQ